MFCISVWWHFDIYPQHDIFPFTLAFILKLAHSKFKVWLSQIICMTLQSSHCICGRHGFATVAQAYIDPEPNLSCLQGKVYSDLCVEEQQKPAYRIRWWGWWQHPHYHIQQQATCTSSSNPLLYHKGPNCPPVFPLVATDLAGFSVLRSANFHLPSFKVNLQLKSQCDFLAKLKEGSCSPTRLFGLSLGFLREGLEYLSQSFQQWAKSETLLICIHLLSEEAVSGGLCILPQVSNWSLI